MKRKTKEALLYALLTVAMLAVAVAGWAAFFIAYA